MSTATRTPRPPNSPRRKAFWIFTAARAFRQRVTKGYRALARVLTLQGVLVDVGFWRLFRGVRRRVLRGLDGSLGRGLRLRLGGSGGLLRRAGREAVVGGDLLRLGQHTAQ